LDVTVTYTDGSTVRHLGQTNMCSLEGSSGGPYYKSNLAYGIHSGGSGCTTFYQSALRAEAAMNVDIVHP
jgi:hypothetical protein